MFNNEQARISVKKGGNAFSVNRKLINSKGFRDMFEKLPLSHTAKNNVCEQVGRLLEYVDGRPEEYLIALDFFTGEFIVDNFEREASESRTGFTKEEVSKIGDSMVILIHNHSYNDIPSSTDLLTFYKEENVCLSIVACHNGELYAIFRVEEDIVSAYTKFYNMEKEIVGNDEQAKSITTTKLYNLNDRLNNRLFDVRRL